MIIYIEIEFKICVIRMIINEIVSSSFTDESGISLKVALVTSGKSSQSYFE